ncbi:hypothetical protein Tco_1275941 [Tanacetum coccineum]
MPDNEIMCILGDDEETDFDKEINTEESTPIVSTTPSTEALWAKKNVPREKPINAQALAAMKKFKQVQISSVPNSDPLGHLPKRIEFLVAHVYNLGKSLPDQFDDKMDSYLPRMVVDALEEMLLELLSDTLKSQFPPLLIESIRETLTGLNRRIRNALHDEMPNLLKNH